mmetsp:Transcript_15646/g.33849  ORF Transcript_15646/g.33849 Transcript_15646/m.33849 type:complete len:86 (+) Transcript_15646:1254-1511(+)
MILRKYVLPHVIIIVGGIASKEYITLPHQQFIMDGCGFIVSFPMRLNDRIATRIQEKATQDNINSNCMALHCIRTSNESGNYWAA